MAFSIQNLTALVKLAMDHKSSDIHIRCDEVPCFRIKGDLIPVQSKEFGQNEIKDIIEILTSSSLHKNVGSSGDLDGSFDIPELCRVRYNIFQYSGKLGIVLRIVKYQIPTLKDIGMLQALSQVSMLNTGLILVTGPTGSGKSTTLAAMINHINENRGAHIVTIEDPIEYLHPQKKSRVTQREIGRDAEDFSSALKSVLRQDPDVILIGEIRDFESITTALKAAETGHVVFATMHTTNALTTINRIVSMFAPHEQVEARKRLSENLKAIIAQQMLPANTPSGIVVAQEIMLSGPGVRDCISGKDELSRLNAIIASGGGRTDGIMKSFDQHIFKLYQDKMISKETALEYATSETDFVQKLNFE